MADSDLWGALGFTPPSTPAAAPTPQDASDTGALKAIVQAKAQKYGIPSDIADRWAQQESSYNPKATSKKGARGLTQLMPANIAKYGVKDPDDPDQNADAGAQMLSELHAKYGEWPKALAAYNAGEGAVDKAGGVPDIPETQNYVKTIMGQASDAPSGDLWGQLGYKPAAAPSDDPETAQFDAAHPKMIHPNELKKPDLQIYQHLVGGGLFDPDAPAGSERHPFFNTDLKQVPPGGYYVANGKVQRAPGGPKESSFTAGLGRGAGDVAASISHILPGSDDSDIKNALLGSQDIYGAKYGGDLKSGAGRFTGQLATSAPMLAGGEAAVAPALAKLGPVGDFLAGQAGKAMPSGIARFFTRGASMAAHGAQQGAGAAALTSSADAAPVGQQVLQGAEGGAVLGPLAPAIENAGGALVRGAKNLIEPMTATGPAKIANRIVGKFARGPIGDVNADEIVPGSTPTLATASADPGLATLERTVRLGPHGDLFAARDAANHQARADFFDKIKGDEDSVQALKDARDAATSGAREAALKAQTKPADVTPVLNTIDDILKGPEGKRTEVVKALNEVRDNLHDAQGNPETSADMLYGVRKSIGDLLSPKASSDKSGAKLAASQLGDVKDALDAAIQKVAPGFKEYLKNYSDLSKPIDEQQLLQGLKIADMRGNITLAKAQGALDKISAMRAKPGVNPAKSVSDDTLTALTAIRDDLKRGDNINLARAIGPDTAQHFSTGGRLQQAGIPAGVGLAIAHHPLGAAAIGGARLLYGLKDKEIMAQVANRLLNPGAAAVSPAVAQAKEGLLKRLAAPVPAAAGGILANRLIPAQ